jgi:two-component system, OmpR family, phosphate regulon response regulator PhoB
MSHLLLLTGDDGGCFMGEMRNATILVVDDDEQIRSILSRALGAEGYSVEAVGDGAAARRSVLASRPDLVVLDLGLPSEDGLDILTDLQRDHDLPVILLTGRGAEHDRVLGLRLGADDYLVKPFSPVELAARIDSVLRRAGRRTRTANLDFGDLVVDTAGREVTVGGEPVELTAREFELLAFLAGSPRQVFTREQLLHRVWDSSAEWQDPATVTEHVRRVRRKIEADPDEPRWIKTVRGAGYRFEP